MSYFALNDYLSNGVQLTYAINWKGAKPSTTEAPYLSRDHVKVYEMELQEDDTLEVVSAITAFTFADALTINLAAPVALNRYVRVVRETPSDYNLTRYTNTLVRPSDFEVTQRQLLFIAQETQDKAGISNLPFDITMDANRAEDAAEAAEGSAAEAAAEAALAASLVGTIHLKFSTYAAQIADTATYVNGQIADVLGYHAIADGGGMPMVWDAASTATHNGGTVRKPTAVTGVGRWLAVNPYDITLRKFGAVGDGVTNDTLRVQAAIDACNDSAHADFYPVVKVGIGRYLVTQLNMRNHVRIVGENESTSHSDVALSLGYGSEFIQPEGTNLDMFLWNDTTDSSAISDAGIEYCSIRGGWIGIGDTTTTLGSAIKFDGCTPTQGCRIGNLLISNFAEDAIELTRHALPSTFFNIWGRKLGGFVINCKTVDGRISHMFSADKIQGDFLVGGLIKVDESSFTGTNSGSAETYLFSNCKHEIDSSATSTTAYSPDTFIFNDVDRAVVTLINCDTQPSNPLGGGVPDTNSVLKITGSKAPYYNIIGCRMGSSNAVSDYLVDDTVRGQTVSKRNRNAQLVPTYNLFVRDSSSDIFEDTRQLDDDTGILDLFPRFKRDVSGKMFWADGASAPDCNLYRGAVGRLVSDFGIQAKKLLARGGTQLQASDFVLSAGWGNTAAVAVDAVSASNHDQRFRIIVTANGSGIAANPTVTLTFVDGIFASSQKWAAAPVAVCGMGTQSTGVIAHITTGTRSVNTLVMTYQGTPSTGATYYIDCVLIG